MFFLTLLLTSTFLYGQNPSEVGKAVEEIAKLQVGAKSSVVLDSPVMISLGRYMERYHETIKLMEKAGFTHIRRFEAIDGSCTGDDFFQNLNILGGSRGEKGCAASHLLLWAGFLNDSSEKEFLFVCEDDVLPHSDFQAIFPIYWEETPQDFDLVMVGNSLYCEFNPFHGDHPLVVSAPTYTTHSYIISKKGAYKLLELYNDNLKFKKPEDYVIDHFIFRMMRNNEIIYYCYNGKEFPDALNEKMISPYSRGGICFQNLTFHSIIKGVNERNKKQKKVKKKLK